MCTMTSGYYYSCKDAWVRVNSCNTPDGIYDNCISIHSGYVAYMQFATRHFAKMQIKKTKVKIYVPVGKHQHDILK